MQKQLQEGTDAAVVRLDLKLSTLKPHVPEFCWEGWKRCAEDTQLVRDGWQKCGLLLAWEDKFQVDALDLHCKQELFPRSGDDQLPSGSEGEGSPPDSEDEAEEEEEEDAIDDPDIDALAGVQDSAPTESDAILNQLAARIAGQIAAEDEARRATAKKRGRPKGSKNKPKEKSGEGMEKTGPAQEGNSRGKGRGREGAKRGRGRGRARGSQQQQAALSSSDLFADDSSSDSSSESF